MLATAILLMCTANSTRLLSEIKVTSLSTLQEAIAKLHKIYRIPHIIVTSIRIPDSPSTVSIVGSTVRADFSPRAFKIDVPAIDCFFSGTGDMFAALTIVRLREAVTEAKLGHKRSWVSPDDVEATDLPLAKAAEKVLGSMHAVLVKTKEARDAELEGMGWSLGPLEREKDSEKRMWLRRTKAAEVRIVRYLEDLREPRTEWKAVAMNGVGTEGTEAADTGKSEVEGEEEPADGAKNSAGPDQQHLAGQNLEDRTRETKAPDAVHKTAVDQA